MSVSKPLRWLSITGSTLMATALIAGSALAQAPKAKAQPVHAKGNITISGGGAAYNISAPLTQGTGSKTMTGNVSGPMNVGPAMPMGKSRNCFTIMNTSLWSLTVGMNTVPIVPSGEVCVNQKKTGTGESVTNGKWVADPKQTQFKGSGGFGWAVMGATTSDLSGTGTTRFTGSIK